MNLMVWSKTISINIAVKKQITFTCHTKPENSPPKTMALFRKGADW